MRVCGACKVSYPIENYYIHSTSGKPRKVCKPCVRLDVKTHRTEKIANGTFKRRIYKRKLKKEVQTYITKRQAQREYRDRRAKNLHDWLVEHPGCKPLHAVEFVSFCLGDWYNIRHLFDVRRNGGQIVTCHRNDLPYSILLKETK